MTDPATPAITPINRSRFHRLVWTPRPGGRGRTWAVVAAHRTEASRRAAEIRASGSHPILPEPVSGRLLSLTVTDQEGAPVAEVQQVAERVWPSPAGGSARARTVAVDRDLSERVRALLSELRWFGLAHVQFLVPEDGLPRLIDLNGRFYGSMGLAVAAGPNFPDLWARLATGRPLPVLGQAERATVPKEAIASDVGTV